MGLGGCVLWGCGCDRGSLKSDSESDLWNLQQEISFVAFCSHAAAASKLPDQHVAPQRSHHPAKLLASQNWQEWFANIAMKSTYVSMIIHDSAPAWLPWLPLLASYSSSLCSVQSTVRHSSRTFPLTQAIVFSPLGPSPTLLLGALQCLSFLPDPSFNTTDHATQNQTQ